MSKIWEFFENLNEIVYVSDIDTYELVYMNKKALQTLNFTSNAEIVGKKCHIVLQGCRSPCAMCNNHELKVGHFKEWHHYNPVVKKHFILKDTIVEENGRRYRMEIALNLSTQELQGRLSHNFQIHETLVNEALRVALRASTPDKSINIILEYMGTYLEGERAYIFEKDERNYDNNTYEWVAAGVTPEKDNLQNVPPEICASWYQNFSENRNIIIPDLEEIYESDPDLYEVLHRQNITSLVVIPLYDDGRAIGFCGIDNPPADNLKDTQDMLQIMSHFLVATLRRRNLVRRLQEMSHRDQLTGLGNRHAMHEYMTKVTSGQSLGVVYCDVTGLKRVNDTEGHEAGDKLILRACECLSEAFGGCGLFRIGGDELLVLCSGMGETELDQRVGLLKRIMQAHDVNLAIGAGWTRDGAADMADVLVLSERLMYEDKSLYYKTCGLDRRKR